jgi:hypothetical protein
MCVECKFGKATGVKLWWNCLRYLVDKVTGLDDLQGRNFSRAMSLPEPLNSRAAEEISKEGKKHGLRWKYTWSFAIYVHRTLGKYERAAGIMPR